MADQGFPTGGGQTLYLNFLKESMKLKLFSHQERPLESAYGVFSKSFHCIQQIQWQKYLSLKMAWACHLLWKRRGCYHSTSNSCFSDLSDFVNSLKSLNSYSMKVLLHLGPLHMNSNFFHPNPICRNSRLSIIRNRLTVYVTAGIHST